MAKAFASQGDMSEKKITFDEVGRESPFGYGQTNHSLSIDPLPRRAGAGSFGVWRGSNHHV